MISGGPPGSGHTFNPLSSANLMRFSSKPWHDHSETYYYGYRFYLPEAQRWPNRDPIGQEGGLNLYAYVFNDPLNEVDPFGLQITPAIPPYPVISKPDPSCVAQCDKQFDDCLNKRTIICSIGGGAAGAGAQIYNKTGRYPGKERLLGGPPSGDYTSRTRLKFGRGLAGC